MRSSHRLLNHQEASGAQTPLRRVTRIASHVFLSSLFTRLIIVYRIRAIYTQPSLITTVGYHHAEPDLEICSVAPESSLPI